MDYDEFIYSVLKSFKTTPDYFYNKQVLLELYETKYGICDHVNTKSPLALVQFQEAEHYRKNFMYYQWLKLFVQKDIGKRLNITFDQFLDRPRYEIDDIVKAIDEINKVDTQVQENIVKDLEAANSNKSR